MGKYLKKFETDSVRVEYEDSENYIEPYVSLVEENNSVHYNKVETRVVAKYNVTSTSSPINIMYSSSVSDFTEIEIDGVVQPTVVSAYTFDTVGEHTVKYTLSDPTSIGNEAFTYCTGLTSVEIPNSVTSIGYDVFFGCNCLSSVTIPNSVTSIGTYAFADCTGLESVTIPSGVTSISNYIFQNCASLTSVTIGSGVTTIGQYAFQNCIGLTSVTIPNSVTSIGSYAFSSCSNLTSVTIGSGVTRIGQYAFTYCIGLTSVTIPNSVTSIGSYAFSSCSNLTSVTSLATTAPTIQSSTFQNVKANGTLTVPSGSSGYDMWMQNANYYLGKYGWTKVEQ